MYNSQKRPHSDNAFRNNWREFLTSLPGEDRIVELTPAQITARAGSREFISDFYKSARHNYDRDDVNIDF